MARKIQNILKSTPTIEGAGVHLNRVFGFSEVPLLDPFLLLDDFRSDKPEHFTPGFPWHPHRGIETITYVLEGDVEHGDSLGNLGIIGAGDVQWMTAGNGIIHQEMPKGDEKGRMYGFQLWANLPASDKMMDPRYRDVKSSDIPGVTLENGVQVKVICGDVAGTRGPVTDIVIDPEYLDVSVPPGSEFTHPTKAGHTVFAYVIEGSSSFDSQDESAIENGTLVLFEDGEEVAVSTGKESVRFLLISGKPIGEPVAWRGPIVMNTQEELRVAFEEYRNDTFIKTGNDPSSGA
ncbi:MAG: pirin family protein [Lentisphaerae bacterium]|nr:pirin family protein [Lentisphaerota bacterium]